MLLLAHGQLAKDVSGLCSHPTSSRLSPSTLPPLPHGTLQAALAALRRLSNRVPTFAGPAAAPARPATATPASPDAPAAASRDAVAAAAEAAAEAPPEGEGLPAFLTLCGTLSPAQGAALFRMARYAGQEAWLQVHCLAAAGGGGSG